MDANMSDLIGGVLSNPEMMNRITTLLPLVTQMMKSDESPPAPVPALQSAPQNPRSDSSNQSNPLANENVAAAVQNLIAALNSSNQPIQPIQSNPPIEPIEPIEPAEQVEQTEKTEKIEKVEKSEKAEPLNTINIEKTLDTLKNVTAVASPENDHRAKLLLSLKPFLNDSRRVKIDTAIKYINAAKILTTFGKNGFV